MIAEGYGSQNDTLSAEHKESSRSLAEIGMTPLKPADAATMEETEFRFNPDSSRTLYRIIVVGLLAFSVVYVSIETGFNALSSLESAILLVLGHALLFPYTNSRRPLYVINEEGLSQKNTGSCPDRSDGNRFIMSPIPPPGTKGEEVPLPSRSTSAPSHP